MLEHDSPNFPDKFAETRMVSSNSKPSFFNDGEPMMIRSREESFRFCSSKSRSRVVNFLDTKTTLLLLHESHDKDIEKGIAYFFFGKKIFVAIYKNGVLLIAGSENTIFENCS